MHKSGSFSHTVELDKLSAEEITFHPCLSPPCYHLHLWEWYSSSSGPFWLGNVDVLPALVAVNCSASHNLPLYWGHIRVISGSLHHCCRHCRHDILRCVWEEEVVPVIHRPEYTQSVGVSPVLREAQENSRIRESFVYVKRDAFPMTLKNGPNGMLPRVREIGLGSE